MLLFFFNMTDYSKKFLTLGIFQIGAKFSLALNLALLKVSFFYP